jgi:hypothetical protein
MPDYDLTRLSSRSFEQLIQSLALKVLTPGLIIFGDGPDGAREATYEGRLQYPTTRKPWDGYLVLQAKFKQTPEGTTQDGKWLLAQLKTDLQKFKKRALRAPEYYLLCTNVKLSAVARKGAKDLALDLLGKARARTKLRDFDIWDYDKLRGYLDDAPAITRTYAAWITPGDVLTEVIKSLYAEPNFTHVMGNFLQKELLADQFVNLKQAGHVSDQDAQIARVFVDLPFADSPKEEEDPSSPSQGFVRRLIETGDETLEGAARPRLGFGSREVIPFGRLVLVGGPGQGKTTVGQHACQLYRAALLRTYKRLSREVMDVLTAISNACERDQLHAPRARRFPLRIVLSHFASWLDADKGRSLLAYIVERIRFRTDDQVDASDLRRWLSKYPWFIVLDGLDEVPASSNRAAVLAAIQDFWIEVANSDVLVLATTRPQGYNQDFSSNYYTHLYLLPLAPARALIYAKRLAEVRYGHDQDRRNVVLTHMKKASEVEATARLMRSPLQVTIMATLVDQSGPPPENRWRLFSEYFGVIYRREMERPLAINEVLRDHRDLIKSIHDDVGLLLQIEAEQSGQTSARLSTARVRAIILGRLTQTGFPGRSGVELADKILEAAANRLVFLVGVQEDKIGFEIRSLQEFFAAEGIMDGKDEQVNARLSSIAPLPYWRNTLLFAASRCASERRYLQTTIVGLCTELNSSGDAFLRLSRSGSLLALDLLKDFPPERFPNHARALFDVAYDLTSRPKGDEQRQLAQIYKPFFQETFQKRLTTLHGSEEKFSDGAWALALALYSLDVSWAKKLVQRKWPQKDAFQIAALRHELPRDEFLAKAFLQNWPFVDPPVPSEISDLPQALLDALHLLAAPSRKANLYVSVTSARTRDVIDIIALPVRPIDERLQSVVGLQLNGPAWRLAQAHAMFLLGSCPLAETLRITAEIWTDSQLKYCPLMAWPILKCVDASAGPDHLLRFAQLAAQDRLGSIQSWQELEQQWARDGISLHELVAGFGRFEPIRTPPLSQLGCSLMPELCEVIEDCISTAAFPDLLLSLIGVARDHAIGCAKLRVAPTLVSALRGQGRSHINALAGLHYQAGDREEWLDAVDAFGQRVRGLSCKSYPQDLAAWIEEELRHRTDRPGLIRVMSAFMTVDSKVGANLGRKWLTAEVPEDASRALVILQMGQVDLGPEDIPRLVPAALKGMLQRPGMAAALARVLDQRHSGTEFFQKFIVEAYEAASDRNFRAREEFIKLIDKEIGERLSGWASRDKQLELGLFSYGAV